MRKKKNKQANTKLVQKSEDKTLMERFLESLSIKVLVNFCLSLYESNKDVLFSWILEYGL